MDFSFDEVQEDVRGLAKRIVGERATPARLKEVEAEGGLDRDLWRELAQANLVGLALPEDVGGSGYSLMEHAVVLEEIGRRVAPVPMSAVGTAACTVATFATAEQRKQLLTPVVEGNALLTVALHDEASSDPVIPRLTAQPDGGRWWLDGRKVAVPYGALADRMLVTTTAGAFVVDPGANGVHVAPRDATNHEPQADVTFDGAVVDEGDMVGDGAAAAEVVAFAVRHATASACAVAVGVLDEAVQMTAAYLAEREQFGRPLATFQGAALRIADAYIDAGAVRATAWSAIWRLATGRPADDQLAMAKFWVADGGQRVVHACQHLHGGMGVDVDYPLHRYFLWAKELELALGGATASLLRLGASMAAGG